MYTGIVVLKDFINIELYTTFLTLHCAVRMLSDPKTHLDNVDLSEILLENFVENFGVLYGKDKVSYNVHNLLHISDCVRQFGPLDNFSAYKFENAMQYLKKKNSSTKSCA